MNLPKRLPKRLTTIGATETYNTLSLDSIGIQSATYQGHMRFGKNKGKLFQHNQEPRYFEWKRTISKARYTVLLNLSHPSIITISGGEWKHSIAADDLPLECVLQVSGPRDNRVNLLNGLFDPHRMSVEDVVKSEGTMLISDTHHMCENARS